MQETYFLAVMQTDYGIDRQCKSCVWCGAWLSQNCTLPSAGADLEQSALPHTQCND